MAKTITVSVKADDGSFESSMSFPIASSEQERRGALDLWLAMLANAVTVSAEKPHDD